MKTPLSFYFIAAVAGALACSDEGGTERNAGGTGGSQAVGQAGSSQGTAGSSQGTAGSSSGNAGAGGAGSGMNLGPALTITGSGLDVVVQDTMGNTGITGGLILAQSSVMTVPATIGTTEGALCMKGTTAVVPDGGSYGTHWGAEISLDLNRAANPAAGGDAGAADAGSDAGGDVLGTVAEPWPWGNVIGFSYKITGNDPSMPGGGVSPAAFRFKAVPEGANTEIDTYCKTLTPINNATESSLFSQILFECWDTTNPSIVEPMLTHSVMVQGMRSMRPNPNALMSISWQIPADLTIGHAFDFCISDLRPILQ